MRLLEVRQDLIGDESGIADWAERLAPIFAAMNADPALHDYQIHASRTGPYPKPEETTTMTTPATNRQTELEAAAFRRLVAHLRERSDVQNIDLMNLAGFCRNCLSNWYREAAERGGPRPFEGGIARDCLRHALRGLEDSRTRAKRALCKRLHLN